MCESWVKPEPGTALGTGQPSLRVSSVTIPILDVLALVHNLRSSLNLQLSPIWSSHLQLFFL